MDIHRGLDNLPGVAWNLTSLAELCNKNGKFVEARNYASEALRIQTQLRTHQRAWALRVLSETAKLTGDLGQAENLLLDSLNEIRHFGNKMTEAFILTRLAQVSNMRGEKSVGRAYLDLARQISRGLENESVQSMIDEVEG